MSYIYYSLLAAMLWAIGNVTDKYTMAKLIDTPMLPLLILSLIGLISAGTVYYFHGISVFATTDLIVAFLAGLFYLLTMYCYYQALKHEEVSKVIPVYYLSPLFILLIANEFLGEQFGIYQYWGIALLIGGAILISLSSSLEFKISRGIGYMLLGAFFYALNQVLTKYLVKNHDFWSVFAYIRLAIFFSLLPIFFTYLPSIITHCKKTASYAFGIMFLNQIINVLGVLSITLAMTSGFVTLVNAIASIQPFFVLVLSLLVRLIFPPALKENLAGAMLVRKFIATGFIIAGAIIVSS